MLLQKSFILALCRYIFLCSVYTFCMSDEQIAAEAKQYARKNKEAFIQKFASLATYRSTNTPFTFFMAGSPGAGKTEISKKLTEQFLDSPVRIDADEIRKEFPHYTGENAHLFQYAASIVVDDLYKHCLKHNLNLIMDGTFAYSRAMDNIQASLDKDRMVEIYFVYQEPVLAWRFTQAREYVEKRRILKDNFIETYLKAIENVTCAKKTFKNKVKLNLMTKDYNNDLSGFRMNITSLDGYLDKTYTKQALETMLS